MKKNAFQIAGVLIAGIFVASGCASLPDNTGRATSYAYTNTADTFLGRDLMKKTAAKPAGFPSSLPAWEQ